MIPTADNDLSDEFLAHRDLVTLNVSVVVPRRFAQGDEGVKIKRWLEEAAAEVLSEMYTIEMATHQG